MNWGHRRRSKWLDSPAVVTVHEIDDGPNNHSTWNKLIFMLDTVNDAIGCPDDETVWPLRDVMRGRV